MVGRRLSRLSEETNRVLACASVIGLEFDPAVVRPAGGFAEEASSRRLRRRSATRLVVEVPGAVAATVSPTPWSGPRSTTS